MSNNSYLRLGNNGRANRRIALLLRHTNTTLESDLQRELPRSIYLHSQRMWLGGVSIEDEKTVFQDEVSKATRYLEPTSPDVAVFGCTSTSALYGIEGEERLIKSISDQLNCPAVSAFGAILRRLNIVKSNRCVLFTPYRDEVTARVASAIEEKDFHVAFSAGMKKTNDMEISLIEPQEIIDFIGMHCEAIKGCDCIVISSTNLRSFECVPTIESKYSVPVITSNLSILLYLANLFNFRLKRKLSSVLELAYHLH